MNDHNTNYPPLLQNEGGSPTEVYQIQNHFKSDERGRILLDIYPNCTAHLLMLPIPFLCVGCFISSTVHITMDFQEKTLSVSQASGHFYMFPCCRKEGRYTFDDIKRVGYIVSGFQEDEIDLYTPVILLTEGRGTITFGATNYESKIQKDVLAMHYYVYGRHNPHQYRLPFANALLIRDYELKGDKY